MRMCEPEFALDNVWHVLDVLEGSPAESAGLVPYGDWIVGWSGSPLTAENDFYELVELVSLSSSCGCSKSFGDLYPLAC
jgi:S1-C subfamily serine protease